MEYVVGFLFSQTRSQVVLVRKKRPEWQVGHLNGVGGKVEQGEDPTLAMVREFQEETGIHIVHDRWRRFAMLGGLEDKRTDGLPWLINFYYSIYHGESLLSAVNVGRSLKSGDEEIEVRSVRLPTYSESILPNLCWLIPMALSMEEDRTQHFVVTEQYL